MYFSPTGASRKIANGIAGGIAGTGTFEQKTIDLTKPQAREKTYEFRSNDILVIGYPVYGGRVPAVLQNVLCGLKGTATPAVLAAVYGNRDYEDALLEGQDLLAEGGFTVLAAGAFIGEHSYSAKVGAGRPDAEDLQAAESLGIKAAEKISAGDYLEVAVKETGHIKIRCRICLSRLKSQRPVQAADFARKTVPCRLSAGKIRRRLIQAAFSAAPA